MDQVIRAQLEWLFHHFFSSRWFQPVEVHYLRFGQSNLMTQLGTLRLQMFPKPYKDHSRSRRISSILQVLRGRMETFVVSIAEVSRPPTCRYVHSND